MTASPQDPFALCGATIDGKYRVLSVVGAGGFGVVYRGVHEGFDAPVAIKCMKLPAALDPAAEEDLLRQLRDEGRLLLQLSRLSPGIVQALDVGACTTPAGVRVPYLVLEWLEGETLAEHLYARRARGASGMAISDAIALLEPAARALAVAHAQKIAHRDVKPENLFLSNAGGARTLKVLDFGIAKVLRDVGSRTEALAPTGSFSALTPSYGAPEQFDPHQGASGPWTDVFALALILVELVTGRRALEGDSIAALGWASIDPRRRPTLRARGAEAPEPVERVLEKALSVELRDRYADAGAFWDALVAAEREVQSTATQPSTAGKLASQDATAPERGARRAPASADRPAAPPEPAPESPWNAPRPADVEPPGTTDRGAAIETPARSAHETAPARWLRLALLAGAICAASALLTWWIRRAVSGAPKVAIDPVAAVDSPEAPSSKSPEAIALYQEAMQAWHDGAPGAAARAMEHAVALDRGLAAAHLRLALWLFAQKPAAAREHFQTALLHRASLGERDRALLDATEPYVRQPMDLIEWERRLDAASARFPQDAEILIYLGRSRHLALRFNAAIEAYDRALALDRGNVTAWVQKGESSGMNGDEAGEMDAYRACIDTAPGATVCLSNRIRLRARGGDCQGVEDDARRWVSIDPKAETAHRTLAMALLARQAPREGVMEALAQSWALEAEADRKRQELADRWRLAALDGDFEGAVRLVRAWQGEVAGRADQGAHADPAEELARLYHEMGLTKEAGQVADDFLRRMGAWTEPTTPADWSIAFLPYSHRAGSISSDAFERARAAWTEKMRSKWRAAARGSEAELGWILWSGAYATGVETAEEAALALREIPADQPLPPERWRWLSFDLGLGKVYALAGKPGEALAPLRRVARSCAALDDPIGTTEAHLYLGMALEATGDREGAAAAYRVVLERWGRARPRSRSADEARARLGRAHDGAARQRP